jgi:cell division transport system permease protein
MSEILTSIRRTPYQSVAAMLVLFLTLFLSLAILFSVSFLYGLLGYVETRPQVTVYFKPETPENDIFKLREQLMATEKVSDAKYISKKEAFDIYKESNKDNPLLLEMVSADILPPSLEIYATKPTFLPEIAEFVQKDPGVDEVNFQKVIIDRLLTLTNIIRQTSFVFFAFLMIATTIILITITHFKVALKKDEIELYRLLGASNFYIRKPFLVEAMFFGVTSAAAAFLIFGGIIFYLLPFMGSYLRGISQLAINFFDLYSVTIWPVNSVYFGILFGTIAFFGILISIIASLLATHKYLK